MIDMIDVRRLEALVALHRTGTVSAAAQQLHYGQPTISSESTGVSWGLLCHSLIWTNGSLLSSTMEWGFPSASSTLRASILLRICFVCPSFRPRSQLILIR